MFHSPKAQSANSEILFSRDQPFLYIYRVPTDLFSVIKRTGRRNPRILFIFRFLYIVLNHKARASDPTSAIGYWTGEMLDFVCIGQQAGFPGRVDLFYDNKRACESPQDAAIFITNKPYFTYLLD